MATWAARGGGSMTASFDVVVAGAGAAGLATAIRAARGGARVALVERRAEPGGIVAHALIHTIAGLYDSAGTFLNPGLPVELAERLAARDGDTAKRRMGRVHVLSASPAAYAATVADWIAEEPNIRFFAHARAMRAEMEEDRVAAVHVAAEGGEMILDVSAVVDCTGEAALVCSIDPHLVLADDEEALAGLVFWVKGADPEGIGFPRGLAVQRALREAVAAGELPAAFSAAWIDSGVRPDEAFVKLSLPAEAATEADAPSPHALGATLMDFLSRFPAFADASLFRVGDISPRGGDRIRGEYRLTVDDVRGLARFADAACRCAWPIEYWDPAKGVQLEYLRDGGHYDIALRSLKVAGLRNVWAAGKCLSSDALAQASARVSGCCWAMGEAVGAALTGTGT
jgi:hypothetical protein